MHIKRGIFIVSKGEFNLKNTINLKKGINLGGWLSQCEYTNEHYDSFIHENDIKNISEMGFDHIRVPFDYELIETDDGNPILENYKYFDNCIEWAEKYGLKVILDMHKAPGYSFIEAYEPTNTLLNTESLKKHYISLWVEMAKRYGKYPDMVAFELLNELVEENLSEPWNILSHRTIAEIRKSAPDTKIIVGGINWNSVFAVELLGKPYDDNIIYNFHCYEPLVFTHQRAYWVPEIKDIEEIGYPLSKEQLMKYNDVLSDEHQKTLRNSFFNKESSELFEALFEDAVKFAEKINVQLYCGEYGVIDQAPLVGTVNWFKAINTAFEKHNIGRAVWNYKVMDFGLIDEHYAPVKDEIIKYL